MLSKVLYVSSYCALIILFSSVLCVIRIEIFADLQSRSLPPCHPSRRGTCEAVCKCSSEAPSKADFQSAEGCRTPAAGQVSLRLQRNSAVPPPCRQLGLPGLPVLSHLKSRTWHRLHSPQRCGPPPGIKKDPQTRSGDACKPEGNDWFCLWHGAICGAQGRMLDWMSSLQCCPPLAVS